MKFTTVIMIPAPHEVQAVAVPIMRKYAADTLTRVPAHLTVLYPFVDYERLAEAVPIVREIVSHIAPFEVTLRGFDEFPGVIFMNPVDPGPIQNIFHQIYARFPECPPYRGQFGNEIHPHMTVGEFTSEGEQADAMRSLPNYRPITYRVDRLHIEYGIDRVALPWLTYDVIHLKR
jgi:2'-5' RNA ligase